MAKTVAMKRKDVENELAKHVDLISNKKVSQYITRKREEKDA